MQKLRRRLYKRRQLIRAGLLVFFFLCGINLLLLLKDTIGKKQITVSLAKEVTSPTPAFHIPTPTSLPSSPSLQMKIDAVLSEKKGSYAVVVKHLKTGDTYYHNEHKAYQTGSLYKLWVMAVVYDLIASQKLLETEMLSADIAVLNQKFSIDSQYAELTEGQLSLTIAQALESMITISHNYAALLLTQKVTLPTITTYLQKHGLNESSLSTNEKLPESTAHDMAIFFEDLYNGTYAPQEQTEAMLTLLKKQQKNEKIPKYLPKNTVVAHKTGEINWFSHDAGIVFGDKGPYIIVVLSESDNPPAAEETIADISRVVYGYFETK